MLDKKTLKRSEIELRTFLNTVHPGQTPSKETPPTGFPWIHGGHGILYPSSQERRDFAGLAKRLHTAFNSNDDLSRAAVDRALRNVVFEVVDPSGLSTMDFKTRKNEAIAALLAELTRPPMRFRVGIEVHGINATTVPYTLGKVHFDIAPIEIDTSLLEPTSNAADISLQQPLNDEPGITRSANAPIYGCLDVLARDLKAAEALAEREVRSTVECLNFLIHLIPFPTTSLYVADRQAGTSSFLRFITDENGMDHSSHHFAEPNWYNMQNLVDSALLEQDTCNALLNKDNRSETEELLLQATRWAGRSLSTRSAEDSVVYAMTALECALLPRGDNELISRLSQRVAWTFNEVPLNSDAHGKRVKELYKIRSRIVHDGQTEVTESDRYDLWGLMAFTLCKLLDNRDYVGCSTRQALEDFLTKQPEQAQDVE